MQIWTLAKISPNIFLGALVLLFETLKKIMSHKKGKYIYRVYQIAYIQGCVFFTKMFKLICKKIINLILFDIYIFKVYLEMRIFLISKRTMSTKLIVKCLSLFANLQLIILVKHIKMTDSKKTKIMRSRHGLRIVGILRLPSTLCPIRANKTSIYNKTVFSLNNKKNRDKSCP